MFGVKGADRAGPALRRHRRRHGLRKLVLPTVDHPQEHFSKAGVGAAVSWFAQTLPAVANPLPADNQVWLWKEIGTLIGFIGCVTLILGVFSGLIATPAFAGLGQPGEGAADRRGGLWTLSPSCSPPPFRRWPISPMMENGQKWFLAAFNAIGQQDLALHTFPQQVNNQLAGWALASGLFAALIAVAMRGNRRGLINRWDPGAGGQRDQRSASAIWRWCWSTWPSTSTSASGSWG